MARVLLATFGSLGDLHPSIAMGLALKARGHVARVATSSDYRAAVIAAGLEFAPVHRHLPIWVLHRSWRGAWRTRCAPRRRW